MSELPQIPADPDGPEEVDGELVAEVRPLPVRREGQADVLDRPAPASLPATLAAATGGFVLGVVAFMLVKLLRRPSAARALTRRRRRLVAGRRDAEVVDTRSFLVDIHLLKR